MEQNYSVKDILDKIVIPKLDRLSDDVSILKERVPLSNEFILQFKDMQKEVENLQTWKTRLVTALILVGGASNADTVIKLFLS